MTCQVLIVPLGIDLALLVLMTRFWVNLWSVYVNRWSWILVCGLTAPALSGDSPALDLVAQSKQFGFQSVSMIVGAYERSDRPASEISQILDKGGLSKLTMPLLVSPTLKPHVTGFEPLGRCRWSWGVYCHSMVQWTARPPANWGAQCMNDTDVLESVSLSVVIVEKAAGGDGSVQVDGVHGCWAAGGKQVLLTLK